MEKSKLSIFFMRNVSESLAKTSFPSGTTSRRWLLEFDLPSILFAANAETRSNWVQIGAIIMLVKFVLDAKENKLKFFRCILLLLYSEENYVGGKKSIFNLGNVVAEHRISSKLL